MTAEEVAGFLDEIERDRLPVSEIGFTGGEPFLNRALPDMLEDALGRGFRALVLTNGMKPMRQREAALLALRDRFGDRLTLRVSLDHPDAARHDAERQAGSFAIALDGLRWLVANDFRAHVAGRAAFDANGEAAARNGFAALFAAEHVPIDATDPVALTLFPEMDALVDVPEITTACWGILDKHPDSLMCASARMVVKRRGAAAPTVLACTLLAYDPAFELGATLAEAARPVPLNHPHCAKFCVLGGAACSR